jgi:nitrile hydratase alpha subunit
MSDSPFRQHHDMGGLPGGPVDVAANRASRDFAPWQKRVEATVRLALMSPKNRFTVDQFRRAIEELPANVYDSLTYFEKWIAALSDLLVSRGVLTKAEVEASVARTAAAHRDEDHDAHDHDHDHAHAPIQAEEPAGPYQVLANALHALLIEKDYFTPAQHRELIEAIDSSGPAAGARLVVRAWTDPAFKQRLLDDGRVACKELGISLNEVNLVTVENTEHVHNVVVCTLCSCYPVFILGRPPDWYKSAAYRSRVVREPRAVLEEFGTEIAPGRELRVHDSTADMRYLVLPMRPKGTEGWSAEQLETIVTRDTMVGVAECRVRQ